MLKPLTMPTRPARAASTPSRGKVLGAAWLAWLRTPQAILFCTLLFVYVYTPPRWQDWNQNSRFALTMALVEQGTVQIDTYADNTGDYAMIDGHRYSDKAPGLSLAAVPVYLMTRALRPLGLGALTHRLGNSAAFAATLNPDGAGTSTERIDRAIALFLATIVVVAFPAALLAILLAHLIEQLWGCSTAGLLTALVFGLATPLLPYASAFYGHLPAAVCITAAFALLVLRREGEPIGNARLAVLGFLFGLTALIEYPALVAALPIAAWALVVGRWRTILWCGLGALPPLVLLALYDLAAFGTVIPVGYAHSTLWQDKHDVGFMSVTYPHGDAIGGLTISPFRGLLFYSPVLILAVPGLWLAWRDRSRRVAVAVAVAGFGATFLFFASSAMWWGGFSVGPRYLVPGLPLLAVPFGAFVAWCNGLAGRARFVGLGLVAALSAVSLALIWATTVARQNYPPDSLHNPLVEYVLPALREGDIARNVGMALRLHGLASLLPVGFVLVIGIAGLGLSLLRAEARTREACG